MKPYERLQQFWGDEDTGMAGGGASPDDVLRLEQRYGLRIPDDFRDYLLNALPKGNDTCDVNVTDWWTLERLKPIPDEYEWPIAEAAIAAEADRFLFFADYMIWCMAWAIHCGEGANRGRVIVISGNDRFVADSFPEFVDRYLADHMALL